MDTVDPIPFTYETDVYAAGLKDEKPRITFNPLKWESLAKERLPANSFSYISGSAGTGETNDNNRTAFKNGQFYHPAW